MKILNTHILKMLRYSAKRYKGNAVVLALLVSFFSLFQLSCHPRYISSSIKMRQLEKGKITKEQYTASYQSWYYINSSRFVPSSKLKKEGAYVNTDYDNLQKKVRYLTMKFTDSFTVICSYQIFDTLSNEAIKKVTGVPKRYTANGEGKITFEDLLTRDFNIYNIYRFARISENGDTISFFRNSYKWENDPPIEYKKSSIFASEISHKLSYVYIYHPELTATPSPVK